MPRHARSIPKWELKGFKVDFLDRDDQEGVEMVKRIAQACADNKLALDLHGIYKPHGLNREYPNIINYEAVFGMEEMKWSDPSVDMPLYDVTFPYIRMMAYLWTTLQEQCATLLRSIGKLSTTTR